MNPTPTPTPPVLTPHPPLNWGHPTSLHKDPTSSQTPTTLQIPLREGQGLMYYDQDGQIQGGGQTFVYQPFTITNLLSGNITPLLHGKTSALIDLMQSIIQTHKPIWTNCQQLLLTLFNAEE
jgi:hypothetical protein